MANFGTPPDRHGFIASDELDRGDQKVSERALRAHTEAASDAREYVQDRLAKILSPGRLAEAQLLASEVVTNAAVQHAGLKADDLIRFSIDVEPGTVRFSIVDAGVGFDAASFLRNAPSDGRGWGLSLVEELSDRWGNGTSTPHRVWFEIDREP